MQFATRRLSATLIVVVAITATACRATGSGASDSAKVPARTDSAPSPTAAAPADSVILRTDKGAYRAGEKMTLTLENKSASSFTFNPCNRSIERQDGGNWIALPDEGRMCTMEAWVLDPHGSRSGPTELPATIAPGKYRVVIRLNRDQTAGAQSPAVSAISDAITIS